MYYKITITSSLWSIQGDIIGVIINFFSYCQMLAIQTKNIREIILLETSWKFFQNSHSSHLPLEAVRDSQRQHYQSLLSRFSTELACQEPDSHSNCWHH